MAGGLLDDASFAGPACPLLAGRRPKGRYFTVRCQHRRWGNAPHGRPVPHEEGIRAMDPEIRESRSHRTPPGRPRNSVDAASARGALGDGISVAVPDAHDDMVDLEDAILALPIIVGIVDAEEKAGSQGKAVDIGSRPDLPSPMADAGDLAVRMRGKAADSLA